MFTNSMGEYSFMVIVLLVMATIMPVVYSIKKCLEGRNIIINHVVLFSFGFWYYWVFPIIVGELFPSVAGTDWSAIYNSIGMIKKIKYLLVINMIYMVFMLCHKIPIMNIRSIEFKFSSKLMLFWIILPTIFFIYLVVRNSEGLFKGYTPSGGLTNYVGPMSALMLSIFSFYVMYSLNRNKGDFKKDFINAYLPVYLGVALILAGYIVTTILSIIVLYTNYYNKIKIAKTLCIAGLGIVIVGIVGLWRINSGISIKGIIDIVSFESLFTAFSLIYFIAHYSIPVIKFPFPLLGSFINLVPSIVMPNKSELIVDLPDVGYEIYSPAGALNSFMSLMVNFGVLGTIIFVIVLVYLLRVLREQDNNLAKLMYSCLCANIAFTFFRDPFSVSIVKNMFEFCIIIPLIVMLLNVFISKKLIHKK